MGIGPRHGDRDEGPWMECPRCGCEDLQPIQQGLNQGMLWRKIMCRECDIEALEYFYHDETEIFRF